MIRLETVEALIDKARLLQAEVDAGEVPGDDPHVRLAMRECLRRNARRWARRSRGGSSGARTTSPRCRPAGAPWPGGQRYEVRELWPNDPKLRAALLDLREGEVPRAGRAAA
jgi:hypothetical protein